MGSDDGRWCFPSSAPHCHVALSAVGWSVLNRSRACCTHLVRVKRAVSQMLAGPAGLPMAGQPGRASSHVTVGRLEFVDASRLPLRNELHGDGLSWRRAGVHHLVDVRPAGVDEGGASRVCDAFAMRLVTRIVGDRSHDYEDQARSRVRMPSCRLTGLEIVLDYIAVGTSVRRE